MKVIYTGEPQFSNHQEQRNSPFMTHVMARPKVRVVGEMKLNGPGKQESETGMSASVLKQDPIT